MSVAPPGAIVTVPGASIEAPALADCGTTETTHVPEPPPASESRTIWLFACAPLSASRSPNESEAGSVKTCGSAARGRFTSPPPSRSTGASWL